MIRLSLSGFLITIITLLTIHATPLHAQIDVKINQPQGQGVNVLNRSDRQNIVGDILRNVITLFFTVSAIGFIIMMLWGATDWVISGGEKEKVATARRRITTAIIGMVVLSLTFVIMVVVGQILSIDALQYGTFKIPQIGAPPSP